VDTEAVEVKQKHTLHPPGDDDEYTLKLIDYGQGHPKLNVLRNDEQPGYDFVVTNEELLECQWRDEQTPLPTPVLRAVEYHGYHVTDVTQRPKHGLYENVAYLKDATESLTENLHENDIVGRAGVNWIRESLDSLQKLELLRAHLSKVEYDTVLLKAYESSREHPDGNLTVPTTDGPTKVSLDTVVLLMLAYAQHDGYLDLELLKQQTVDSLVMEPTA
jgi:hypothetical protein